MDFKVIKDDEIRQQVSQRYAKVAAGGGGCCGPSTGCCADPFGHPEVSEKLGYSGADIAGVPEGANMGLGCGNPQAIAQLKPGETVLDLGSGGGFDCFLAARQVGVEGKVIGVDMTPEMISKARKNAINGGFTNVEFRLGEIEHLPVADNSVDVIISNCVINLSPDKPAVFAEAYRVLRPQGRIAVSDVVALKPLPEKMQNSQEAYCDCVAGAVSVGELEQILIRQGFDSVQVDLKPESAEFIKTWFPDAEKYVCSASIKAVKR
jgi:SAM-dependent methyltransferase